MSSYNDEKAKKKVPRVPKVCRYPHFSLSDYMSGVYRMDRNQLFSNIDKIKRIVKREKNYFN